MDAENQEHNNTTFANELMKQKLQGDVQNDIENGAQQ